MSSAIPATLEGTRTEVVTAPPARPHQHMPALDGLRGTAILLVLFYHLVGSINEEFDINHRFSQWAELGWTGVDLFFVLSGFLITGILYDSKGKAGFFKNFYARRSLRIFPLYYTALLVVVLAMPFFTNPELEGTENPAWISIFATNFVISAEGSGSFGVLDHYWSLAVEEHFYLVWPAVIFFLKRKQVMMVAVATFLIAPTLRIMTMNGGDTLPISAYMSTPMRMDSLAAGAFVALLVRGPKGMEGFLKPAMILACVTGAVFFSMIMFRHSKSYDDLVIGTAGMSVLWAFFGSVLILALKWKPLETIMRLPVLRWFGKYSFGLYVWHPIVFMLVYHNDFARHLRSGGMASQMIATGTVALAATFTITLLSWNLWEKQFLKMKSRFA